MENSSYVCISGSVAKVTAVDDMDSFSAFNQNKLHHCSRKILILQLKGTV